MVQNGKKQSTKNEIQEAGLESEHDTNFCRTLFSTSVKWGKDYVPYGSIINIKGF